MARPCARSFFFYGSGGSVIHSAGGNTWLANLLSSDLLTVDYRGTGFSDGRNGFATMGADALAIVDYARQHSDGRPLHVMGYSLGTAVAVYVATQRPLDGVILLAPFTSVEDLVAALKKRGPWYTRLVRTKIDPPLRRLPQSVDEVQNVNAPLLIVHGTRDDVVPFEQGQKLLASAASTDKQLCAVNGADHESVVGAYESLQCIVRYFKTHR